MAQKKKKKKEKRKKSGKRLEEEGLNSDTAFVAFRHKEVPVMLLRARSKEKGHYFTLETEAVKHEEEDDDVGSLPLPHTRLPSGRSREAATHNTRLLNHRNKQKSTIQEDEKQNKTKKKNIKNNNHRQRLPLRQRLEREKDEKEKKNNNTTLNKRHNNNNNNKKQ